MSAPDIQARADEDLRPEPYNTPEDIDRLFEQAQHMCDAKNGQPVTSK